MTQQLIFHHLNKFFIIWYSVTIQPSFCFANFAARRPLQSAADVQESEVFAKLFAKLT